MFICILPYCQTTCWPLVQLLMYKCVDNIVPTGRGDFIYTTLFYKLKKVKDVLKCDLGWEGKYPNVCKQLWQDSVCLSKWFENTGDLMIVKQ